jgi:hypothetical protein
VKGYCVELEDGNGKHRLPWLFPTRNEARRALAVALQESHAQGGRVVEERVELQAPTELPIAAASETGHNATPAPDGAPLFEITVASTGEKATANSLQELLGVIRKLVELDPGVVVNLVLHLPALAAAPSPRAARARSAKEGGARD